MKIKDDLNLMLVLNIYKDNSIVKLNIFKQFEALYIEKPCENIEKPCENIINVVSIILEMIGFMQLPLFCSLIYCLWECEINIHIG